MALLQLLIEELELKASDEAEVEGFVHRFGVAIPLAYQTFFKRQNGGLLNARVNVGTVIGDALPTFWLGLEGMTEELSTYGDAIGEGMLPFCRDPGGNLFCVQMRDAYELAVHFVDIDGGWEDQSGITYPTYRVAKNLDEFASNIVVLGPAE